MRWSCEAARFKVGEPGADGPSPKIYSTWNQEASFFHPPQAEQELEDHVPGLVSSWKLPCWIVRRYQHHYWSVFINLTYEKCQYFIITILLQGVQEWAEVINAGNIKDLFMDRGLESVNLNSLKRLWRISGQVNNALWRKPLKLRREKFAKVNGWILLISQPTIIFLVCTVVKL